MHNSQILIFLEGSDQQLLDVMNIIADVSTQMTTITNPILCFVFSEKAYDLFKKVS